ncbi:MULTISPECIES: HalOD1 output domain-containing protein [Haloarcula]|uniref:HalOD1 output domain-containing protein n=1 Tax=Haloarcula TaxID=2237 RepID=UPI0023EA9B35|nr:HalOD1 output domain-containing protein [Halomicroarcula sp. XH51]
MRERNDSPEIPDTSVRESFSPEEAAKPSDSVVRSVAALTDTDPVDLPVLYDATDTGALDRLTHRETDADLRICFTYAGMAVALSETGELEVATLDD